MSGLTIEDWRARVKSGLRKGLYVPNGARVTVKRVWPNRLEVVFTDPRLADEFGPAAPAGRTESVHPADVTPVGGLW